MENVSENKFVFFAFRDKKNNGYLAGAMQSEMRKSARKYEDTLSTRLWRVYGKLIWRPILRFVRKSVNSKPFMKPLWKSILPEQVEHPEFQYYSFIFMNKAYRFNNPIYVLLSYPVCTIKKYFLNNSHLVCNWNYSVSKTWRNPIKYKLLQRPLIHFAKWVEHIYRSDFHCCGNPNSICDESESDRFELIHEGVSATPDGTDYWFRGYVHCDRCNTPVEHSDSSL